MVWVAPPKGHQRPSSLSPLDYFSMGSSTTQGIGRLLKFVATLCWGSRYCGIHRFNLFQGHGWGTTTTVKVKKRTSVSTADLAVVAPLVSGEGVNADQWSQRRKTTMLPTAEWKNPEVGTLNEIQSRSGSPITGLILQEPENVI